MIDFIKDAETYLKTGDYASARRCYVLARRDDPDDWRGWFGLARVITHDFTVVGDGNWKKLADRAYALSDENGRLYMNMQIQHYFKAIEQYMHSNEPLGKNMDYRVASKALSDYKPVPQNKHNNWSESHDRVFGIIMVILTVTVITLLLLLAIRQA